VLLRGMSEEWEKLDDPDWRLGNNFFYWWGGQDEYVMSDGEMYLIRDGVIYRQITPTVH
jgi:hypothetical protein